MDWIELLRVVVFHPITLVGVGSAAGGNLRYWLGRWIEGHEWAAGLPWGTFIINVSGSFLLGFFGVLFLEHMTITRRDAYLLLGTGFCGGYTTFSTFELETFGLIRHGNLTWASLYVISSVVFGFLGILLGVGLAHLTFPRR